MKSKLKFFILVLGILCSISGLNAQTIKGKVVDKKSGEPLVGAAITFGEADGIVTDAQGEFSLDRLTVGDQVKASFLGYKPQEIKINDKSKDLIIRLEEDVNPVEEVVVIGYGVSSREKLTGSVSTISAETLAQYSGSSLLEVLQGRVAGLTIAKSSGLPGSSASINIRGVNSLGGGFVDACGSSGCCLPEEDDKVNTEPLIVVDGVPFPNQSISPLDIGAVGAIGPLATLSTSDIERIDILKDADATAIYGSRGSNGVILITTKKELH